MLIDDKYSPFNVKRYAGTYSSFSVLIDSISRQLEIKLPCTQHVIVKESQTTDSVYFTVSFKEHSTLFKFSIRNHSAHEMYKGETFLIQKYNNEEHLFKAIRNRIRAFNEECLSELPVDDEISPFGESLMNALREGESQ